MNGDPDAWISWPQPSLELCRLYHGIDCRRGCAMRERKAGLLSGSFVIEAKKPGKLRIHVLQLPSGKVSVSIEEL